MDIRYTREQVRERQVARIAIQGHPNPWWPSATGNDCVAFQTERLGLRTGKETLGQLAANRHWISIQAFEAFYGWPHVPSNEIEPGDLILWNFNRGKTPEHMEYVYSVDHDKHTVTTISANTGPRPGYIHPIGSWKKTRPITTAVIRGIRVPYTGGKQSKARTADVMRNAAYLNGQDLPGGYYTKAAADGQPGNIYWRLIQLWGRAHGQYGTGYHIDGVPGPRTYAIEKLVTAAAKKAQAKKAKK